MVFASVSLSMMNFYGVLPGDDVEQIRLREGFRFIICSMVQMFILIPSILYLIAFHATEEVYGLTDLMYTIVLFSGVCNAYLIIFIRQITIRDLINEVKSVVAKRELTPSKKIYADTSLVVDTLCQTYAISAIVGCAGVFVMPYAKPLYHFLAGKYSFASWYTPYKTMVPYDMDKTPLGFAFVLPGQQISGFTSCMCAAMTISLHITLNFYVIAGVSDMQASLQRLNNLIINEMPVIANIHYHLVEILKLNWWIIRFREEAADILSGMIFNYILVGTGVICALLYQFQVSAANSSIQLYQSVGLLFATVIFLFILCAIGTMVTEKSLSIGQSVYASLWYKLPPKHQRYFMLMIQYSHIPFGLTGWGLINCNLETFVALVKTAVSVYMIFRNLGL